MEVVCILCLEMGQNGFWHKTRRFVKHYSEGQMVNVLYENELMNVIRKSGSFDVIRKWFKSFSGTWVEICKCAEKGLF